MRILVNMGTLKLGGGQNVGLNFLKGVEKLNEINHELYYIVANKSLIHEYISKNFSSKNYLVVSSNPYFRIFQERFNVVRFLISKRIDIIYTYFGYGNFPKKYPQVMGVADSNLFYPEIDFWSEYSFLKRLYKRIIDKYRLSGYNSAAGLIFENMDMLMRYKSNMNGLNRVAFIKPSIYSSSEVVIQKFDNVSKKEVKGLFLCGWQLNKNILIIPELIKKSCDSGYPLRITITAPLDNSKIHKRFIELCKKYNVSDRIDIIGPVKKDKLSSLYMNADFVFLLSKLESFSNNIIESWYYRKPLIVSDLDWARSICKEAAIYVNRESADDIILKLQYYTKHVNEYNNIIKKGHLELLTYHSFIEKASLEIKFLEEVFNNVS